jgi:hypothetical protein
MLRSRGGREGREEERTVLCQLSSTTQLNGEKRSGDTDTDINKFTTHHLHQHSSSLGQQGGGGEEDRKTAMVKGREVGRERGGREQGN